MLNGRMTFKKTLSLIATLTMLQFASCDKSRQVEVGEGGFSTFSIDVTAPKNELYDLIESVEVLQLEETERAMLGSVLNYDLVDGRFFIFDINTNAVIQFSKEGKYLASFSKTGSGPDEFSFALSYWVDGDSQFMYDSPNGRIQVYSLDGVFKRSIKLPFGTIESVISDNGKLYLNFNRPIEGKHKYHVLVLNLQGEVVDMQVPYSYSKRISTTWGYPEVRRNEVGLIQHMVNNDTVYLQQEGLFKPFVHFDFGSDWAWEGVEKVESSNDFQRITTQPDKVSSLSPIISKDQIYLSYSVNRESPSVLIDVESGKMVSIKNGYETYRRPLKYESGRLVFKVDSDRLGELLEGLAPSQVAFIGGTSLERIETSENPSLVRVKFKDSAYW